MAKSSNMQNEYPYTISKKRYLRSRGAVFLTIVITIISVMYVIGQNFMLKENYQVSEVQSSLSSLKGRSITVQANVKSVDEGLDYPPVRFRVTDGKSDLMVTYGSFPYEGFKTGDTVMIAGKVEEDGNLTATRLLNLSPE